MDETKKKELFPYFAYLYSQQMNPEKYGQIESMEEWIKTIQESEDDTQQIIQAAEQLTDEDWENLDEQYSQQKESNDAILAAKGAKLKKLKSKAKKCKCGCDMVTVKEKGGKMISKCSCGCGGNIKKGARGIVTPKPETRTITSTKPTIAGNITKPSAPISDEVDISIQRALNEQLATDSKQIGETFKQAFARNRKLGAKEFTFNGKRYTTQLASDVTPKPVSQPTVPVTKPTVPVSTPPAVPRSMPGSTPAPTNTYNWVRPYNPPLNTLKWYRPYLLTSQKTFPGVAQPKPFSLLRKDGGTISKQAGGPVKPTTKPAPKKTEQTPDNSPERNAAKKYKSEFYSKNGVKYDTQSGLPIAPMKAEGGNIKYSKSNSIRLQRNIAKDGDIQSIKPKLLGGADTTYTTSTGKVSKPSALRRHTIDNAVDGNVKGSKTDIYDTRHKELDKKFGKNPNYTSKKQSGGDINQQIGSTKKDGKAKNRLPEKVVVVPPPALKKGKKLKSKTKK